MQKLMKRYIDQCQILKKTHTEFKKNTWDKKLMCIAK